LQRTKVRDFLKLKNDDKNLNNNKQLFTLLKPSKIKKLWNLKFKNSKYASKCQNFKRFLPHVNGV
jgi:hypothetical protein